jgi:hypothetical protein
MERQFALGVLQSEFAIARRDAQEMELPRLLKIALLKIALLRITALVAAAGILCGFDDPYYLPFDLNAYQGEPVRAAIARLGPPVQTGHSNGRRIYYWRTYGGGHLAFKIWGTAQHNVITDWGYLDCAF